MLSDLRLAIRLLRKHPAVTAIAVVPLALDIGATAAVFSLIQGVLLTPPPYRQPDRLVLIPSARADGQPSSSSRGWAPAQWMEWQRQATSFDAIAAYGWSFNFLIRDQGSESIEGMVVTKDYFRVVGLQPILGRTFLDSEIGPTAPPTIIIGYDLWRRTFNGNPNIVGQTVRMSRRDTPPTIIGVMPPNVRFLPSPGASKEPNYDVNAPVDFWMPVAPNPKRLTEPGWNVVGRLKDGVQSRDAQAELTILVTREAQSDRELDGFTPVVRSLTADMNQDGRRVLLPLLGAAALGAPHRVR